MICSGEEEIMVIKKIIKKAQAYKHGKRDEKR